MLFKKEKSTGHAIKLPQREKKPPEKKQRVSTTHPPCSKEKEVARTEVKNRREGMSLRPEYE